MNSTSIKMAFAINRERTPNNSTVTNNTLLTSNNSPVTDSNIALIRADNLNSIGNGKTIKVEDTLYHLNHVYENQLTKNYRKAKASFVIGVLVLGVGIATGGIGYLAAGTMFLAYALGKATHTHLIDSYNVTISTSTATSSYTAPTISGYTPAFTSRKEVTSDNILNHLKASRARRLMEERASTERAPIQSTPPALLSTAIKLPTTAVSNQALTTPLLQLNLPTSRLGQLDTPSPYKDNRPVACPIQIY